MALTRLRRSPEKTDQARSLPVLLCSPMPAGGSWFRQNYLADFPSLDWTEVVLRFPGGKLLGEPVTSVGDIRERVFNIMRASEVSRQSDPGLLENTVVFPDCGAQAKLVVDVRIR